MLTGPQFDEITTTTASRLLGLTRRRIQQMAAAGAFAICYRPGCGSRAHILLSRQEILSRKNQPQTSNQ